MAGADRSDEHGVRMVRSSLARLVVLTWEDSSMTPMKSTRKSDRPTAKTSPAPAKGQASPPTGKKNEDYYSEYE